MMARLPDAASNLERATAELGMKVTAVIRDYRLTDAEAMLALSEALARLAKYTVRAQHETMPPPGHCNPATGYHAMPHKGCILR